VTVITCFSTSSPATLETARSVRSAAGDAATDAGASEAVVNAVVLCTGEAVTNAALHAYPSDHGLEDTVDVVVERSESELTVIVTDFGSGFPHARAMQEKGFGLSLIERLASRYVVSSARDVGTTVRMVFVLRPRRSFRPARGR